jgi:hypothetical protein
MINENTILLKRTRTPNLIPNVNQLSAGEVFIQVNDGKILIKQENGVDEKIVEFLNSSDYPFSLNKNLSSIVINYGDNNVNAELSNILGGYNNLITGVGSVIVNGGDNQITSDFGFIGSGFNNSINPTGQYSAILGGQNNKITHQNSFTLGSNLTSSNENFTYVNNISGVFWGDGSNITSKLWDSSYTTVNLNSANWNYQGSDIKSLTGNWQSAFTTVQTNSSIWSGGGTTNATFATNLTVSLPGGRTFGRYSTGEVIPAAGKTPLEVIQMAIAAPITPTASLNSSTTIAFNQTAISNVLTFGYTINTLGASIASASLEWRRNNTGSWNVLSSSTVSSGSFTHTLTDTANNTQPFNYRYIVTDTSGATITVTRDIIPASYVAPTISLSIAGVSLVSPESTLIREKGRVSSNLSGSISRNSANVALSNYIIQYQVDSGSWIDIGTVTTITGNSVTISSTNHNPTANAGANSISYRIKVVDAFQTSYSNTSTITFKYLIFYGDSSTIPTNSNAVRNLTNKIFADGTNPFNLITGVTNSKFTVAMPNTQSITLVEDLDAFNLNITTDYVNNPFSVNDAAGNPAAYKVYTKSQSVPYTDVVGGHRHRITRV